MAQSGGYGVRLRIGEELSEVIIVHVDEIDELQLTKFISEATGHDSAGGYYEAVATGKFRIQPFNVGIWWDSNEASHIALITSFNGLTSDRFEWLDPAGGETIVFRAFVEMIGRVTLQEGTYRANLTLHPTGEPTIT